MIALYADTETIYYDISLHFKNSSIFIQNFLRKCRQTVFTLQHRHHTYILHMITIDNVYNVHLIYIQVPEVRADAITSAAATAIFTTLHFSQ